MRRIAALVLAAAACLGFAAPSALALNPEQAVTGLANSNWYSGSLIQQYGTNCSTAVLGSSYPEVMTSAIGSYGGTAGVVTQNSPYWASILVSVPGNPCGPGSSGIQTDLFLPPGTSIDTSRQVRCFGLNRGNNDTANGWAEITNGDWSLPGVGSGKYCSSSTSAIGASTLSGGGYQVGFRLIASGQLYKLFVPIKSTQVLNGAAGQVVDWLVSATAAYANPALSRTQAYVFPTSAGGNTPSVFFSQTPAAKPYWEDGQDAQHSNRVELWANVNTAGKGGVLTYDIKRTDDNTHVWGSTDAGAAWNGTVSAGQGVVQVIAGGGEAKGPTGGYSPVYFDPPGTASNPHPGGEWNVPMRVTWTFTPTTGPAVSGTADFKTLPGKDTDHDGVSDTLDACPAQAGDGANGCTVIAVSLDSDLDGVLGAADLCPTESAPGTVDGCLPKTPAVSTPTPTPTVAPPVNVQPNTPAVTLSASLAGAAPSVKRTAITGSKGAPVTATCTAGATATLTLTATKATVKALKLKLKKGAPLPAIGSATATCAASGATTFSLKLLKSVASKVKKAKGSLTGTLTLVASRPGAPSVSSTSSIKLK